MAGLSGYSKSSVILTFVAVFFVMASAWMAWYTISNGHTTVSEYWLDHFDPEWGDNGVETYDTYGQVDEVMLGLKFFTILWFLVSLFFVGQIMREESGPIREIVAGATLIALGIGMLAYFALAFPGACPSPLVSGFFSSATVSGVVYTGSPGGGFYLVAVACVFQALAVTLRLKSVFSRPRSPEPTAYEARVGTEPPK
jgi:hypothetical protein